MFCNELKLITCSWQVHDRLACIVEMEKENASLNG
jgi:hypothetical protein